MDVNRRDSSSSLMVSDRKGGPPHTIQLVSLPRKQLILQGKRIKTDVTGIKPFKLWRHRSYESNQLFRNSFLTTPDPICCRMLELVSVDLLPVMKVGGHMDGRRVVRPLKPLNDATDVVGSIGTLVLAFGIPPPCRANQ